MKNGRKEATEAGFCYAIVLANENGIKPTQTNRIGNETK